MRTARLQPYGGGDGVRGSSQPGMPPSLPSHTSPSMDRHLWNYYLSTTSFAGGKKVETALTNISKIYDLRNFHDF